MIKRDIRFKENSYAKIKAIAENEKKTFQDTVRELCDIGIAYKEAKGKEKINTLSPIEEETLKTLYLILSLNTKVTPNIYDLEKSKFESIDDLILMVKAKANDYMENFKDKNNIA